MGARAGALADQFEQQINELAKAIEQCPPDKWGVLCGEEQWTVAATAHHVATQFPLEMEYLLASTTGTAMPPHTWDDINARNAKHAEQFKAVSKDDALKALRENAAPVAAWVRALTDEQLERTAALPLADGAQVSTEQLLVGGVLIDHARAHAASIRAAI
jgi:hypothetical protein